jgi:hypothetical protein
MPPGPRISPLLLGGISFISRLIQAAVLSSPSTRKASAISAEMGKPPNLGLAPVPAVVAVRRQDGISEDGIREN